MCRVTFELENMRVAGFLLLVVVSTVVVSAAGKGLQIGVKKRPEKCEIRSKKGDRLSMHYNVSETDMHCLSRYGMGTT